LSATALLQGRTVFEERLQLLVKGSGRAKAVVADSWPDGTIRGVLDLGHPEASDWVAAPGVLQVMRSNAAGQPYIGNLELVEGGIQVQVEHYLQSSEQIQASLTLWCDPGTGEAGGLLVELLPDCPPARLARVVQAIEGLDVVPYWERTAEFLAHWVSQGEGTEELAVVDLFYRCRCTRETLLETLRRFPEAQKTDLFKEGEPLEVRCDYCGTLYPLTRADLLKGDG
jgi:molecular chaperone Hsp33